MYSLTLADVAQATGWGPQMVRGIMEGVPHREGFRAGAGRAVKLFRPADVILAGRTKRRRIWTPEIESRILTKLTGKQDD